MAVDNKQIATDVLELVGGAENVSVATNCMTRLRLTLKDNNKVDVEKIKKVKGVLGCQFAGAQLQVIIGQNVPKVLAEFVAISGVKQGEAVNENLDAPKEKFELKNLPNIILDYLSGSMTQLIPLLMAGGLFRTIAAVLGPTMLGVLSADDPTYTFLYTTLYEATFTFIPIYLGYAAAKKLGASPVLGMLLGGALMAPSVVSVATQEGGGIISVYGIQIAAANYQQSVLPIILSVPVLYFIEKFFKKVMPDVLSTVFTPFCTMIVTIPIAFIVLAPIGNEIGTLIANALFGLADLGAIGILIIMAINGDMTARVIDYGEWRFGYRIDGLAFSGSAVMSKIMSAAATAILGFTLTAVGYQGGMAELPATALSAINNMFLWVPCVALVVSGIFYIMLNLSNKRVAEMRAEIAARALKKPENTEI